ncbi:MAG: hypothetical protein WC254_06040 [Candidatus Woesearchaeota archaeon]|jgi:hypothetical protein
MINKLSKYTFWISFVILLIIFIVKINDSILEKEQYEKVQSVQNPDFCESINSFKYQAQCYSKFIGQDYSNYSCSTDACFFAYALHIEDDWYCDKVFPDNVPLNLECRVSVFIERYTHEGLSDCCHI